MLRFGASYIRDLTVSIFEMLPRFLHKTFILAVSRFQPDVIVYLGDLFDEGSKAQEPLFQEYVQRFKDIFRTEEHVKVQIQWNHLLGWSQLIRVSACHGI